MTLHLSIIVVFHSNLYFNVQQLPLISMYFEKLNTFFLAGDSIFTSENLIPCMKMSQE